MSNYKVSLKWEVTVRNADSEEEAITAAAEQLHDNMADPMSDLGWEVKEVSK